MMPILVTFLVLFYGWVTSTKRCRVSFAYRRSSRTVSVQKRGGPDSVALPTLASCEMRRQRLLLLPLFRIGMMQFDDAWLARMVE
jgi:hypothetical protein